MTKVGTLRAGVDGENYPQVCCTHDGAEGSSPLRPVAVKLRGSDATVTVDVDLVDLRAGGRVGVADTAGRVATTTDATTVRHDE